MPKSSARQEKIEQYAHVLYEAGGAAGRTDRDLVQWRHAVKFSPEVLRTISAMESEEDAELIEDVYTRLQELVDTEDKTVMVTVTTAVKMDAKLRKKVIAKAKEMFNAPVYLAERIEPSILGGIILEARGERFDASVATQLASVRRNLSTTFVGDV